MWLQERQTVPHHGRPGASSSSSPPRRAPVARHAVRHHPRRNRARVERTVDLRPRCLRVLTCTRRAHTEILPLRLQGGQAARANRSRPDGTRAGDAVGQNLTGGRVAAAIPSRTTTTIASGATRCESARGLRAAGQAMEPRLFQTAKTPPAGSPERSVGMGANDLLIWVSGVSWSTTR